MDSGILKPGDVIIPFGTTSWTAGHMRFEEMPGGGWEHDCPVAYAVVGIGKQQGSGHRLSGVAHNLSVPTHIGLDDHAGMLTFLENRTRGLCDIFNKRQVKFVRHYFSFIRDHLAANASEVDAMARGFHGLYEREHWLFAAFAPLPQAHIYLGGEGAARFLQVPLVIWTDEGCVAVYFSGAASGGGKTASDQARLRGGGIQVLELREEHYVSPKSLESNLPNCVKFYWRSQPLPVGPFAAELVEDLSA